MLGVNRLEKRFKGQVLLDGANFQLEPGEKAALVGINGSGKSTILRICAGLIEPDAGEIAMSRGAVIGYLPQHAELDSDRTLVEELRTVFADVQSHFEETEALGHKMAELDHKSEEFERVAERFSEIQHELDRLQAYELDSRIDRVVAGLGFSIQDRDKVCARFSGGWRMRILLAKLLLQNPDVMLLDEPTNHLDLETMIWLENWIRNSDATVLFVSHERKFMDSLANRVIEVHEGRIAIYRGGYTDYLRQRDERWAQWKREYENQQEEIAHLKKFIDRFRANASKATLVQSRVKALEKIVRIPAPPRPQASIHFRFPEPDRGSKEVFAVEKVSKIYGPVTALNNVEVSFFRGDKVALVGLNGAGKSTLLKVLAEVEKPTSGRVVRGTRSTVEYFAQYDADGLTPGQTIEQEISTVAPIGHMDQARALLGGFFFSGDDLQKPVDVLSGGERTRLRLAKMLFSGANALLLDEPTNHLDIASRATLEQALKDYAGTVIFVSHDRSFLDSVATRVVEVREGVVRCFPGNYTEYCLFLKTLGETSPLATTAGEASGARAGKAAGNGSGNGAVGGSGGGGATSSNSKSNGAESAEGRGGKGKNKHNGAKSAAAQSAGSASGSAAGSGAATATATADAREASKADSKERRRLKSLIERIEREVEIIEARLKSIDEDLAKPDVYRDFTRSKPLQDERARLARERTSYTEQWDRYTASMES